jgi:multidrug efflux system membrane fusion protein
MNLFVRKPYILAFLISIALGVWLLSGQGTKITAAQEVSTAPETSTSIMRVQVREQTATLLNREIIVTGRTAPLRTAQLRAEIEAKVVYIGVQRGARVKKGDLIVRLATDDRTLRLKEAQALLKQRELEYQAKQKLSRRGYQSKVEIAEALTLLESAKTQVKQTQIALEHTMIRAPFAGVLEDRSVELGDFVSIGDVIAEVIDTDPFLIIGEVTELQRKHLRLGKTAISYLVTGETVKGKITRISARANAATRTFNIEIKVSNPKNKVVAGVTSEIRIPIEKLFAHQVSAALLSLNDEGLLGVKTVTAKNQVAFYPANFARATAEGIWLTGLPKRLRFITVGQGFVRPSDLVHPVLESAIE